VKIKELEKEESFKRKINLLLEDVISRKISRTVQHLELQFVKEKEKKWKGLQSYVFLSSNLCKT
jgi:hypothetical protein